MESDLDNLEQLISVAVECCVNRIKPSTDPVHSMTQIVAVMELAHVKAVGSTILSVLEVHKQVGGENLNPSQMLGFLEACEHDFSDNLRTNLSRIIKERGLYDIFDPNAKVREEILSENS